MPLMEWHHVDELPTIAPVPMQQHRHYGRACKATGTGVQSFCASSTRHPKGTAQVLIRRWPLFGDFALLARGPTWAEGIDQETAAASTMSLVKQLRKTCRGVMVTSDPVHGQDPLARTGLLPMVSPGCQARLPLTLSQAERMARQHGKWRNRLRRAQDGKLRIDHAPLPDDPQHWLLLREETQSKRRGYKRLPAAFTYAWRLANGPKSTRLFVARYRKAPVAAMLFLLHGKGASYHIGWSDELGRQTHAHNLLLWEASNWLADRGYAWADLGTLDTQSTPGLARFKLGAGATPFTLGATCLSAPGSTMVASLFGARRSCPTAVDPFTATETTPQT